MKRVKGILGRSFACSFFVLLFLLTSESPTIARALSSDTVPPVIVHFPVAKGVEGRPIFLYIQVTDDVQVTQVVVYYRRAGESDYTSITCVQATPTKNCSGCKNIYDTRIPGSAVTTEKIEYYINATDGSNFTTDPPTNPVTNPHVMSIKLLPTTVLLNQPSCIKENSLQLNWTRNANLDFKNYTIYQSEETAALGSPICRITEQTTTSYNVTCLAPDTTYYFTVRVYDTVGLFTDSNRISAKTKATSPQSSFWIPVAAASIIIVIGAAIGLIARIRRESHRTKQN